MVTNKPGYEELISFLACQLDIFERPGQIGESGLTVGELIEDELADKIINVCAQNAKLNADQRNEIIRETDHILHDLQEVLSGNFNQTVTQEQQVFILEFTGLVKNLFDSEVNQLAS